MTVGGGLLPKWGRTPFLFHFNPRCDASRRSFGKGCVLAPPLVGFHGHTDPSLTSDGGDGGPFPSIILIIHDTVAASVTGDMAAGAAVLSWLSQLSVEELQRPRLQLLAAQGRQKEISG